MMATWMRHAVQMVVRVSWYEGDLGEAFNSGGGVD
jgi:hypothetical protein